MKTKLNYLLHILIIIILLLSSNLYAETEDAPADSSSSGIALDAVYIDLTTIGIANDISIIADIEFIGDSVVSFGLQPSYSYFRALSWKARDISFLTYFSLGYNFPITLKATIGFSYHMWRKSPYEGMEPEEKLDGETMEIKYGIATILNISRFFKIHAKCSWIHDIGVSAIGLGVSVGWSR